MNEKGDKPILIVIRGELTNPPSEPLVFRDLTLYQAVYFKDDIVIETNEPDVYARWLRGYGCLDFIKDFVPIEREKRGLKIDFKYRGGVTVVADRIVAVNLWSILEAIAYKRQYV